MESTNMNDLGETYPSNPCGCSDCEKRESGKGEQKKHYPREAFTTEQMPELKGIQVGDTVKIVLECEVCSVSKGEEYPMPGEEDGEVKTRVTIKMLKGSATKMESTGTMADEQKKKEKDFSKTIGLEEEDEKPEEEDSEAK